MQERIAGRSSRSAVLSFLSGKKKSQEIAGAKRVGPTQINSSSFWPLHKYLRERGGVCGKYLCASAYTNHQRTIAVPQRRPCSTTIKCSNYVQPTLEGKKGTHRENRHNNVSTGLPVPHRWLIICIVKPIHKTERRTWHGCCVHGLAIALMIFL